MHPDHRALLDQLRQASRPKSHGWPDPAGYLGAERVFHNVTVPDQRRIAKAWILAHKAAAPKDVLAVVDSLFAGPSHEEKTLAALVLASHSKAGRSSGRSRWTAGSITSRAGPRSTAFARICSPPRRCWPTGRPGAC